MRTPIVPVTPEHNVASLLLQAARMWPRLPAVAHGAHALCDYAGLAERAAALAHGFARAGLRPGDRLALVSRNVPAYIEALFACWWAGLTAVPVNAKLHPRELAFVLSDSGARWAFVDAPWHAAIGAGSPSIEVVELGSSAYAKLVSSPAQEYPVACAMADPAWLFYTSGTTGRPKGVVISHGNLRAMG